MWGGDIVEGLWADTLEAMRRIVAAGMPLNAAKLKLIQLELPMLGVVISEERFQLGRKALAKAFASELPRTLQEL